MTEATTTPAKPLSERTDEELYALVEKHLSGPPYTVDRDTAPERPDDPDGEAQVIVRVSVAAWDFPSDESPPA